MKAQLLDRLDELEAESAEDSDAPQVDDDDELTDDELTDDELTDDELTDDGDSGLGTQFWNPMEPQGTTP